MVILDVRERDEFKAEHCVDSVNMPLSEIQYLSHGLMKTLKGQNVVIMCRSGKRAELARQQLAQMGYDTACKLEVYGGGILKWKEEGKPTQAAKKRHLPLMRQVQIVAGSMVVLGVLLAVLVNFNFIWLAGFVGAGLTFAGVTGFCALAEGLAKMPWNKLAPKKELCDASPASGTCLSE